MPFWSFKVRKLHEVSFFLDKLNVQDFHLLRVGIPLLTSSVPEALSSGQPSTCSALSPVCPALPALSRALRSQLPGAGVRDDTASPSLSNPGPITCLLWGLVSLSKNPCENPIHTSSAPPDLGCHHVNICSSLLRGYHYVHSFN